MRTLSYWTWTIKKFHRRCFRWKSYNGNIGYEIDEAYRGNYYALSACRLALRAARSHNMKKIFITCESDNVPSYKTIEKLGASLIEEVRPPKDWIYYYEGIEKFRIYELRLDGEV